MGKTDRLRVLVAGCGTGLQSIELAQEFPRFRILAVDLSLSSLCYAREKTRGMGIRNVEYAQADILELNGLESSFDIIVACGVLHHLSDPEGGWRKLLSLLTANGCMQVALYSAAARRNLSVAQNWLAKRGFGVSHSDIRRVRQELMRAATHEPALRDVINFSDFYSVSECRDLLLHKHESHFTIPRLAEFLAQSKLALLGFDVDHAVMKEFVGSFSPQRQTDLASWNEFEMRHPDTFANMYTFWVQRQL